MKKLFACDLDGTLLNIHHETDSTINEGLQTVFESQNPITIATGRSYFQVKPIGFPKGMCCICMNGAMILDEEEHVIHQSLLDKELIKEMLDLFEDYLFEYVTKDGMYCLQDEKTYFEKHSFKFFDEENRLEALKQRVKQTSHFSSTKEDILKADICKLNIQKPNEQNIEAFEAYLEKNKDKLVNAATFNGLYEITSRDVNKGKAIHILAKHFGIEDDQVYVYGDAGNDIEMLKQFHHAFVPENGTNEAKQYALEIIGHNKDYSVISHILKNL